MASSTSQTMWQPSEWTQAAQYYSSMLNPAQNSAWNTAQTAATNMASPDYYNKLWNAQSSNLMNQWSDQTKQLAEQAGVGGTRYSSSLGRNIGQVCANLYSSMYPQFLQQRLGGQQNAISSLYNIGSGQVGAGSTGASGLAGVGSLEAQLPLSVASAMGQASQYQNQSQVSPYMSMLSQLLQNSGTTPTTYQQSGLGGALQSLMYAPWGSLGNGGNYAGVNNGDFTSRNGGLFTTP